MRLSINPDLCSTNKSFAANQPKGVQLDRDHLSTVNPFSTLRASYGFISAAQDHPPAEQVAGIAVLFRLMCTQLGLDISEELHRAERIEKDADMHYAEHVRALKAYINNEIKGAR